MKYLTGEQIELRAIEPEDLDCLYRWENDASLWVYGSTVAPLSRFQLKQYIAQYSADIAQEKQLRLMIILRKSQEPVGLIDCFDYDPIHQRGAIGILIAPPYQRKGLGRDALTTFQTYAFQFLHIHQLYAHVPATNTASMHLFQSCGFQTGGTLHDWLHLPHGYVDAYILQKFNAG